MGAEDCFVPNVQIHYTTMCQLDLVTLLKYCITPVITVFLISSKSLTAFRTSFHIFQALLLLQVLSIMSDQQLYIQLPSSMHIICPKPMQFHIRFLSVCACVCSVRKGIQMQKAHQAVSGARFNPLACHFLSNHSSHDSMGRWKLNNDNDDDVCSHQHH